MAYPLRRPWLFKLEKTNIKHWKDVTIYCSQPTLLPSLQAVLIPFLVLNLKISVLQTFNLKKRFFMLRHAKVNLLKKQFFYLLLLICSNRLLVIFFFKLQYLWLKEINGLFFEKQHRLWIIFLMFLKLNFKSYLFDLLYFNQDHNEEILTYKQFKWRISLGNFFSFGRYVEYIRRITYNAYLANMYNKYSVITRSYHVPQYWTTRVPDLWHLNIKRD